MLAIGGRVVVLSCSCGERGGESYRCKGGGGWVQMEGREPPQRDRGGGLRIGTRGGEVYTKSKGRGTKNEEGEREKWRREGRE